MARFPKRARLLKPAEFSRVFKDPIRSSDRFFTILAASGSDADLARLGLAISKKHAKRAVDRNRIKRLVRESFRQYPNLPKVDLVVMARETTAKTDSQTLLVSLTQHWKRLCAKLPAQRP
jgi:ribonuclease P protein component